VAVYFHNDLVTDYFYKDNIKNRFSKQWIFLFIRFYSIECFLSLGAATKKEWQNLWVLGSTSELVNLTILAKEKSL
jgi:hypothetical protein